MNISSFEIIKSLAKGAYSNVYLAKSKKSYGDVANNQLVAIKVIGMRKERSIIRETGVSLIKLFINS